jgi:hypothetical protein
MRRAWLESIAVDAIGYQSRAPSILIAFEEFGVRADQSIASEEAVFGFVFECWPIAILCNKDVGGTAPSYEGSPKHPVYERVTTANRNVVVSGLVMPYEFWNERQLFVACFVAKAGN